MPVDEAIASFYDTLHSDDPDAPSPEADEFMEQLVRGASAECQAIDERIQRKSANWRLERMPSVDRNLLRLAVYEMTSVGTPAAIGIDEALELAHQFSSDESVSFVNGVLDAVSKDTASPQ